MQFGTFLETFFEMYDLVYSRGLIKVFFNFCPFILFVKIIRFGGSFYLALSNVSAT